LSGMIQFEFVFYDAHCVMFLPNRNRLQMVIIVLAPPQKKKFSQESENTYCTPIHSLLTVKFWKRGVTQLGWHQGGFL
jgi:hypothetical protein